MQMNTKEIRSMYNQALMEQVSENDPEFVMRVADATGLTELHEMKTTEPDITKRELIDARINNLLRLGL